MLKIYNSLTNKIESFETVKKGHVNMYVCGPTVYDDIHIGNGRPVIFFDMVKRYLNYLNYSVTYASNITDVDDKIITRAKEQNISEKELSSKYTNRFLEVVNKVNANSFDYTPHATDYIKEMIEFIQKLIDEGFAYVASSGVYFRVDKISDYGILSNQRIEDLKSSIRIENETDKEKEYDFALWKFTTEGIKYPSPWKEGRPGWHTECVVMNHELFDQELDIHGGGFDLKFPHHENEIAQSMAHNHHHLAKFWMHVGRLDLADEKMSKSLGNDIKLDTLIKSYNPNSYRLMILAHHYRQPIQFSDDLIEQYQKSYDKISYTLNKWNFHIHMESIVDKSLDEEVLQTFKTYMNDDFKTPRVISLIDEQIKLLNKAFSVKTFNTIIQILTVLGIEVKFELITSEDIQIFNKWHEARIEKNYALADKYRSHLLNKGFI